VHEGVDACKPLYSERLRHHLKPGNIQGTFREDAGKVKGIFNAV
jgi:hypothetical protein